MNKHTELITLFLSISLTLSSMAMAKDKPLLTNDKNEKCKSSKNINVLIACILSNKAATQWTKKKSLHSHTVENHKTVFHF